MILTEQCDSCYRLIENCLPQHFDTESKFKLAQPFLQLHDNASRNRAGAIAYCSTCLVFLSHLFVSRSPARNFHPKILPFPIRPDVANLATRPKLPTPSPSYVATNGDKKLLRLSLHLVRIFLLQLAQPLDHRLYELSCLFHMHFPS